MSTKSAQLQDEYDQKVEALAEEVADLTLRYQGMSVGSPHDAIADAIRAAFPPDSIGDIP